MVRTFAVAVLAISGLACSREADRPRGGTVADNSAANSAGATGRLAAGATGRLAPSATRSRSFRFDYGFTVTGLAAGSRVRVWMPVPPSNRQQTVAELGRTLPAAATQAVEPVHGNRIMYLEPTASRAGALEFLVSYRVTRREVKGLAERDKPDEISPAQRRTNLAANAYVPLGGKPAALLDGMALRKDPLPLARQLYDLVDAHVSYDSSKPGYGRGDAVWVCDSKSGNCSDFHSLFISLARSRGIPARFEIGFPLDARAKKGAVSGYHCWAGFFVDGRGWVPVDISEADKHPALKDYYFGNLTEHRVAFSTGRDLVLVPPQAAKPLNFFIDPHVEVNGKTWPAGKIERKYSFEELGISAPDSATGSID